MAGSRTSTHKKTRRSAAPATAELLLEIGTEELPFQFIAPARRSLEEATTTLLAEQRLVFQSIRSFATPRRLALSVQGLASSQTTTMKETMGPPKSASFDAGGQPTKAATGFAASQGVPVSALEVRQLPKGEYLFAVKRDEGRPTQTVLRDHLGRLIQDVSFPKSMKWNETGFRFARPLRWILALFGTHPIVFDVGGLRSGTRTYGHRVLGGPKYRDGVRVHDASQYQETLKRLGVIVDPIQRRSLIEQQLNSLAQRAKGQWRADEGLVEQAVYAVEHPSAILGSFDAKFLALPPDIIETAMKEHQGFFALLNEVGTLLPQFLAVTNISCRDMTQIRKGNERVLAARLSDAAFYFSEDQKIRLEDRAEKLESVVFHQKLGTMGQKAQRLVRLAGWLAVALGQNQHAATSRRAAQLCKADLLTGVVGEFPTLQGIMGGVYAGNGGEPADVAAAIRDHYAPRGMEGKLPETAAGKIVSLADRFDTIAAFFAAGMTPKGSEDPFALRRHALSIVRILLEGNLRLDLGGAVRQATEAARHHLKEQAGTTEDPLPFILERFRFYVGTTYRCRADLIDAAVGRLNPSGPVDLLDMLEHIQALQGIAGRPEFDPLIVGFKRAHRLVQKEKWTQDSVQPDIFQHAAEKDLYAALLEAKRRMPDLLERADYAEALSRLVGLKPQIDEFFAGVMVNAEEPQLRANRLSLLHVIDDLFLSVADFSAVVEQALADRTGSA